MLLHIYAYVYIKLTYDPFLILDKGGRYASLMFSGVSCDKCRQVGGWPRTLGSVVAKGHF